MKPTQIILKEQSNKTLLYINGVFVTSFTQNLKYVQQWLKKNIQNYEVKVV